ncbi:unnamed protein product, partial [Trichogramma brassicae]
MMHLQLLSHFLLFQLNLHLLASAPQEQSTKVCHRPHNQSHQSHYPTKNEK